VQAAVVLIERRGAALADLVLGGGPILGDRLGDAIAQMLVQQPKGDRLQGLGHRRHLGEQSMQYWSCSIMRCSRRRLQ
jgi:hypothetical protein